MSLLVVVIVVRLFAAFAPALTCNLFSIIQNLIQVINRTLIVQSSVALSVYSVEPSKNLSPTLSLLSLVIFLFGTIVRINISNTSDILAVFDPINVSVVNNFGITWVTGSSTTTSVARLFNRNVFISYVWDFVYNWLRNSYWGRNSNVINLIIIQVHVALSVNIRKNLSFKSALNLRFLVVLNSNIIYLLDRNSYWDLLIKVSISLYVLGSASVNILCVHGNWLSINFILSTVYPVDINFLFDNSRLNELFLDLNISWNNNSSKSLLVPLYSRKILRFEFSFDVISRNNVNWLSVVDDLRLNSGVIVNLISWNVDGSLSYLFGSLKILNNSFSFYNSGFALYENWVDFFDGGVNIRLNDDLLSGRLNNGIGNVSYWSGHSFGNNSRFLYHTINDRLGLTCHSLYFRIARLIGVNLHFNCRSKRSEYHNSQGD